MLVRFTKMHGLGNDFLVLDTVTQKVKVNSALVAKLADRNFGVGFDQMLIVEPPSSPDMDFRYRIYNADGSEVEHCGNGARCFARFVRDKRLTAKETVAVETMNGPIYLTITEDKQVVVDMGVPVLEPQKIPFSADAHAATYPIDVDGQNIEISAVSMGNPHGVLVVDSGSGDDCIDAGVNIIDSWFCANSPNHASGSCAPSGGDCPDGNLCYDECADCNENGRSDFWDIYDGLEEDCNGNGVPDVC